MGRGNDRNLRVGVSNALLTPATWLCEDRQGALSDILGLAPARGGALSSFNYFENVSTRLSELNMRHR